nr:hypothetical protein [Pseudarthrobacter equi]
MFKLAQQVVLGKERTFGCELAVAFAVAARKGCFVAEAPLDGLAFAKISAMLFSRTWVLNSV